MRLDAWNKMLPYYFTFNKTNYARYGSYYVQLLKQIDNRYKGLKVLLNDAGISVQAQETHPLRVSVDQRGEQTINRDAKTAGKNNIYKIVLQFILLCSPCYALRVFFCSFKVLNLMSSSLRRVLNYFMLEFVQCEMLLSILPV